MEHQDESSFLIRYTRFGPSSRLNCQSWFAWALLKQIPTLMYSSHLQCIHPHKPILEIASYWEVELFFAFFCFILLIHILTLTPGLCCLCLLAQKHTLKCSFLRVQVKALTYCSPTDMRSDALTQWRGTTVRWYPHRRTLWLWTWMWQTTVFSGVIDFTGKSTGKKIVFEFLNL